MTILMIMWLAVLTGYVGLLKQKLFKSEASIKYLLPFIQDKTLKVLTSYIDNDSNELSFDENGELIEKQNKIELEPEPTGAQSGKDWVQFFILTETNPFILYSSVNEKRAGNHAASFFEDFTNAKIELLALPEEYLK
jgi:hypothetical protein